MASTYQLFSCFVSAKLRYDKKTYFCLENGNKFTFLFKIFAGDIDTQLTKLAGNAPRQVFKATSFSTLRFIHVIVFISFRFRYVMFRLLIQMESRWTATDDLQEEKEAESFLKDFPRCLVSLDSVKTVIAEIKCMLKKADDERAKLNASMANDNFSRSDFRCQYLPQCQIVRKFLCKQKRREARWEKASAKRTMRSSWIGAWSVLWK